MTDMYDGPSGASRPMDRHVFRVAQIFNLPYRRFVIGRTLLASGSWQVNNLRYSRPQVCATGAASTLNKYCRLRVGGAFQLHNGRAFAAGLGGTFQMRPPRSGSGWC